MKTKILVFFSLVFIIFVIALLLLPKPTLGPTFTQKTPVSKTEPCPEGYILIPGSDLYKTQDFCVMKYDAKCTNTDLKCVTGEGVYKNNISGCECQGNFKVVSKPDGAPITYIPEDDSTDTTAKSYCLNSGAHLVTNNEWMTIARNVEQVKANWCNRDGTGCGNAPGTDGKILANGHNDSLPNHALVAGSDDSPCFGTTSDGSDKCGKKSSQKRTLTLNNGQTIWDFAGNVWQWIDITLPRKDEPLSNNPLNKYGKWVWEEFSSVDYDANNMPSNSKWTSAQGVGRIFHYSYYGDSDSTPYTFIRAGNWRHGYDSGAFTYHEQPIPGKTGIDDVGFRCVTMPQ